MEDPVIPKLYSQHDVARALGLSYSAVGRIRREGKIQAHRVGGEYRYSQNDIDEYLTRQRTPLSAKSVSLDDIIEEGMRP